MKSRIRLTSQRELCAAVGPSYFEKLPREELYAIILFAAESLRMPLIKARAYNVVPRGKKSAFKSAQRFSRSIKRGLTRLIVYLGQTDILSEKKPPTTTIPLWRIWEEKFYRARARFFEVTFLSLVIFFAPSESFCFLSLQSFHYEASSLMPLRFRCVLIKTGARGAWPEEAKKKQFSSRKRLYLQKNTMVLIQQGTIRNNSSSSSSSFAPLKCPGNLHIYICIQRLRNKRGIYSFSCISILSGKANPRPETTYKALSQARGDAPAQTELFTLLSENKDCFGTKARRDLNPSERAYI